MKCLAAISALLTGSCIVLPVVPHTPWDSEHRGTADAATLATVTPGQTTRTDVLLRLGEPDLRGDGDRSFGYVRDEAWLFFAVGGQGGAAAGELSRHLAWMVAFDADGRVQRHEVVRQSHLAGDAAWYAALRSWR